MIRRLWRILVNNLALFHLAFVYLTPGGRCRELLPLLCPAGCYQGYSFVPGNARLLAASHLYPCLQLALDAGVICHRPTVNA